ncbi:hypothetical protein BLL42_04890 [Pseudomonas frederiksbergensis]|uniref:SHSP domain-containing protein n=1 Tax=Pseudomonas frederiksbergensis TaxID=104087 RepID=A0A1J0EGB5_9PSED|nr:hypothetical protein BLL42_04890 [Pseudomonas frederiksbergensis]
MPKGIDADKIEAKFSNGVLSLSLPKKPDAIKPEKTVPIRPVAMATGYQKVSRLILPASAFSLRCSGREKT